MAIVLSGEVQAIDFKGEAITFRTTTAAVLDTLAHCAELVAQREEAWRKRLERETERRRRCEGLSRTYFEQLQKMRNVHPGPDLEVSTHLRCFVFGFVVFCLLILMRSHRFHKVCGYLLFWLFTFNGFE